VEAVVDVIMEAGKSAVDTALFILLPIMVVLMILMRLLEAWGVLDWVVRIAAPVARPFGLTGLGVLAMIQISFVSFAAPIPTLAIMDSRGVSQRRLCAAFAAVLAMAPANAMFPLIHLGVAFAPTLIISLLGGVIAASVTYWLLARNVPDEARTPSKQEDKVRKAESLLSLINLGGNEAIRIVLGLIPMLLLSLAVVVGLEHSGLMADFVQLVTPFFVMIGVSPELIVAIVTKCLAGNTALVGIAEQLVQQGKLDPHLLTAASAYILQVLDLPGMAIFCSAVPILGRVAVPAMAGAFIGIVARVVMHAFV